MMTTVEESRLDKETGEICRSCFMINVETGELEFEDGMWYRKRIFRVPKHLQKDRSKRNFKSGSSGVKNMVSGTNNVNPIVFMLPTLFLFPAWATILCLICEACVHIWSHKR